MKRREASLQVALTMSSALSAPTMASILAGYQPHRVSLHPPTNFTSGTDKQALLAEISEVIMTATSTPGAKEAQFEGMQDLY